MSRKTNNYNAYESTLSGPLAGGATSVAVESAVGLVAPLYLVIDPDVPDKREWVRVNTINSNTLDNLVRNQEGSVGDVSHDAGAKIRSIPTKQIFDDLFQDIEDTELDLTQHETDGGDPHAQAGYLKQDDGDVRYVEVLGDTMSGALSIVPTPTLAAHATRKDYVDAEILAQDHDHDTPIATHAAIDDAHHVKYTDAEALLQAESLDHDHDTPIAVHAALPDAHHVAFVQADADLLYVPLVGAGDITFNSITVVTSVDADTLDLTGDATVNQVFTAFGTAGNPGHAFAGASGLGVYAAQTGILGFTAGGVNTGLIGQSVFLATAVFSQTSGAAVNVSVDASGQLFRNTSARKYKSTIKKAPQLADLDLVPVTFKHKGDGQQYIGFIADDLADQDARLGEFHEGEIESYDMSAVVAVLAAKVNRLESA